MAGASPAMTSWANLLHFSGRGPDGSPRPRHPAFGRADRRSIRTISRLSAMQRLADFADREKRAGARFFRFQLLRAAALNQRDEAVEDRQRLRHGFLFGELQRIEHLLG